MAQLEPASSSVMTATMLDARFQSSSSFRTPTDAYWESYLTGRPRCMQPARGCWSPSSPRKRTGNHAAGHGDAWEQTGAVGVRAAEISFMDGLLEDCAALPNTRRPTAGTSARV
jgi:hypothetical protein